MILNIFKQMLKHFQARRNPSNYLRSLGVNVGENCRFYSLHPGAFGSEPYLISIGNNVTVTAGVRFITHDGSTFVFREKHPDIDVMGPIRVGDNTFIGLQSIIMPGVIIGKNCIVGAMSVVTRPVPDGSVVAGNPAKIIMRTDELEQKLLERNTKTGQLAEVEKKLALVKLSTNKDKVGREWLKAT